MSKKKAFIYTLLFAIVFVSGISATAYIKPAGSEMSVLHAFAPFFVGLWAANIIDRFYKYLRGKK